MPGRRLSHSWGRRLELWKFEKLQCPQLIASSLSDILIDAAPDLAEVVDAWLLFPFVVLSRAVHAQGSCSVDDSRHPFFLAAESASSLPMEMLLSLHDRPRLTDEIKLSEESSMLIVVDDGKFFYVEKLCTGSSIEIRFGRQNEFQYCSRYTKKHVEVELTKVV